MTVTLERIGPPSYLTLGTDELVRRSTVALELLGRPCRVCPRHCRVDRSVGEHGLCLVGREAVVASHFAHFGEEDCLRGRHGSGTIFLAGCSLRCVFCQNFEIAWSLRGEPVSPARLASIMLELQAAGCHNVNWVTPEHVVPQLLESMPLAAERGLRLPIVYNTSAYDALDCLGLLDGVVDVYMPDFKLWTAERARRYLKRADYPDVARAAITEMHRQVGDLVLDEDGLARHGLLVRHLVLPGLLDETERILHFVADELGPNTYLNLMGQYRPCARVGMDGKHLELNRPLQREEYMQALAIAGRLGLARLDERSIAEGRLLRSSGARRNGRPQRPRPERSRATPEPSTRAAPAVDTGIAIGASLHEARVRQGLEHADVEHALHIRGKYLVALEEERFDAIPGGAYAKAFLRSYAEFLGLDAGALVDEYNGRFSNGEEVAFEPIARRRPGPRWSGPAAGVVVVALTLLAIVALDLLHASHGHKPIKTGVSSPPVRATQPVAPPRLRTAGPVQSNVVVRLHGIGAWDPDGDRQEHDAEAPAATDGDPATFWRTETYTVGLQKPGVGLLLDARRNVRLRRLVTTTDTPGYTALIEAGRSRAGPFEPISTARTVAATTTFALHSQRVRYYVLWITALDRVAHFNEARAFAS
jgi:putative pyruvate formate lyase activating enzyme